MPKLRSPLLIERLVSGLDDYPRAVASVARYIVESPEKVIFQSLSELSEYSGAGQATIFRLCRALGFSGFSEFKLALSADLATSSATADDGPPAVRPTAIEQLLCSSIRRTAGLVVPETVDRVARRIRTAIRVDIFGSGVSGIIGELLAYRLLRLGVNANSARDPWLAHEVSSGLDARAVVVAVSQSGATANTVTFMQNARRAGAYGVALTCYPKSLLARSSDDLLLMARLGEPSYGGPVTDVPRAILLIEVLAAAIGDRVG